MFSVSISFLFVFSITYSATTINDNINTGGNLTVSGANTLTGAVWASSTLQAAGAARFYSTARIDGATTLNSVSYTWPSSDGSSSQYLQTNGAGTLSWVAVSSPDWIKQTNFGVLNLTASTTIPYWAKDAIYASSTLQVQGLATLANASTTQLSIAGNLWLNGNATTTSSGNINGQGLLTMLGTGTSTFSGGIQSTALNITSATASSTFANGIILSKGCFLMPDGTCAGAGGGSGTINSGITGQLSYYAGSGTTLTATSSLFIHSNQNVGIGTTTPNWLLQVVGTRPFLTLSDTGAATDQKHWFLSSQGGNFYVGTSSDAYATSTVSKLTILSNGNIGIGTTTPQSQFALQGNAYFAGNVGVGTAEPGAPLDIQRAGGSKFLNIQANADMNNIVWVNIQNAGGNLRLGIDNSGGNGLITSGGLAFASTITSVGATALNFATTDRARMTIDPVGNIGIGTTSPYTKLSVVGETVSTYFTATSTTATSTFLGAIGVGTSTPTEQLSVSGRLYVGGTGTSTIENNFYVRVTLRSTVSYVGDLIFSNNFRFIETNQNEKIQSLFLQNQYGENIFKIDENGKVIVKEIEVESIKSKQGNFEEKLKTKELQIGSPQNRTGITIYDEKSGKPYCLKISDGKISNKEGECK